MKPIHITIMGQCHPYCQAYPRLDRQITENDCAEAVKLALDAGLSRLD
jgi:uncharacterized Fe-S radical SAM superfamily protein PflX